MYTYCQRLDQSAQGEEQIQLQGEPGFGQEAQCRGADSGQAHSHRVAEWSEGKGSTPFISVSASPEERISDPPDYHH